jgi:predicted RNase H-like HicB family nuclease
MARERIVHAEWDDQAGVWVATSDDVPGLVTESKTFEALLKKLRTLVPELLELNGAMPKSTAPAPFWGLLAPLPIKRRPLV